MARVLELKFDIETRDDDLIRSGASREGPRPDPAASDTTALHYRQQALVPLGSEAYGGEDVVVRASGPMAFLFKGTIEQHSIFHVLREALAPQN